MPLPASFPKSSLMKKIIPPPLKKGYPFGSCPIYQSSKENRSFKNLRNKYSKKIKPCVSQKKRLRRACFDCILERFEGDLREKVGM